MDHTGGYMGAIAMLSALLHRRRTGRGQYVDLSQVEAAITLTGTAILDYTVNGRASQREGNRSSQPAMAPHGVYRCGGPEDDAAGDDHWIAIAAATEGQWHALATALGHDEWRRDPTFPLTRRAPLSPG